MGYIAGLVIAGMFFLSMHYFTELTKSQKVISSFIIFAIISLAVAYNTYTSAQQEKILNTVLKFNQNKTIKCNGIDVNNSNYTLSIGTYTFIGKKNTQNYGKMIGVSSCK